MRVLLISENRSRENLVPYPLGLAYIATAALQAGHDVRGIDLMFSADADSDIREAVREFEPEVVGLSVRNIDNQEKYSGEFYMPAVRRVTEAIGRETDAPVVAGGAGFTIFPLECLSYLGLELGIVGEGEVSFVRLLESLEKGSDPCIVPGVASLRSGVGNVNRDIPYPDFENSLQPDREVFDVSSYDWVPGRAPPFAANLEARRGCHMKCIYCTNPLVEGRVLRLRHPGSVADELESLERDHGLRTVIFTDSLFNYPSAYSSELCREIIDRRLSIGWSCTFTPTNPDAALLGLLREAGCFALSIGNESGSEDMLAALRKGFGKEQVAASVREAKRLGFEVNCFLLLGGPGETRGTVEESIDFVSGLEPDVVRVTVGIRIYPGCELADIALGEGVIEPGQNLLEPAFYLSPAVEPWLRERMLEVCSERPGWGL